MNAGRAAAAPRALVPFDRFHQRIARRSLYGLNMAFPAPVPKNLCAVPAGMVPRLPLIDRRHPVRPPPTRGDHERKCWRSWVRDGQLQRKTRRHAVPLPTGECGGRESGLSAASAETRAPTAIFPCGLSIQSRLLIWRNPGGNWPCDGAITRSCPWPCAGCEKQELPSPIALLLGAPRVVTGALVLRDWRRCCRRLCVGKP